MRSLSGIGEAIALESLAQGSLGNTISPGLLVLRRGILIAGLIALEAFVRDRTSEALRTLERWPKSFDQLPEKLRLASRLNALQYLQQYAKMLKRQGDDYEGELQAEIEKMSSGSAATLRFTKFVAGDYTGNVSDQGMKDLLSSLQVHDCWSTFRQFAADAGIGVPSVHELVKSTVRKRHRSAHSPGYSPTATEITELRSDLLCIAMCFDVSVSSSMEQALAVSDQWAGGETAWRDAVHLYAVQPHGTRYRLLQHGRARALRLTNDATAVQALVPRAAPGTVAVLVKQDAAGRPNSWNIL
ncbi:hypothetical protein SPMU_24850 [Sphingomonas mucosissima]|uniref:RiboL-PSP-HEPN domain-containing protein n=2 Tax=Sphingomonas mucosissima TaxID=370959 RepID=A0A245ZGT6_9SPHN|nr:hypothetical protein SPMU_24850 [Sphingomonas mucosissima]